MGWEQSGARRTLGVIHGHCARLQHESTRPSNFPENPKILKRYEVSNVDISFVNRDGGACVHMCVHICMCVSTFVSWCVFTFVQTWRSLKWMFHILFTRSPPHILRQGLSVELRVHRSSSLAGQFCPRHLRPLLRNDR